MKTMNGVNLIIGCVAVFCLLATVAQGGEAAPQSDRGGYWVFAGTYTGGRSKGIYVSRLDGISGKLAPFELAAETANPTFLAIDSGRNLLFAANEIGDFEGKSAGAISSFKINQRTGQLAFLNQKSSVGSGPCHLTLDRTGNFILLANYGGGSVAVLPVQKDGQLGESVAFIQHAGSSVNAQRQGAAHAHSINVTPDNRFALAADLGLDKVLIYRFQAKTGALTDNDTPYASLKAGAGPRHLAIHPKRDVVYVINELNSTLTVFSLDPKKGSLRELQTVSTLPMAFQGVNYPAEVQVHPSGKFVYGSNRGHDSLAVFAVSPQDGTLEFVEHQSTRGKFPRNFAIDPAGKFLLAANQNSHNITVFRIDPESGRLTFTGQDLPVGAPVCIRFLKAP